MKHLACPNCAQQNRLVPPQTGYLWYCIACGKTFDEGLIRKYNANLAFMKLLDTILKPSGSSRAQLCREAGINPSFLSQCEAGEKNPSNQMFRQLKKWAVTKHGPKLGDKLKAKLSEPMQFLHKKSRTKRREK